MASKSQNQRDLQFMEYLGDEGFKDRQDTVNEFIQDHEELFSQRAISPRIFQRLVDEQMEPVIETRKYLVQELNRIWNLYWKQINTPRNEANTRELQQMSDTGTLAKNKYQDLLKDVVIIVTGCAPRVNWRKHGKRRYQRELAEWIQKKHTHLASLVDQVHNYGIKSDLEVVRDTIAHAAAILTVSSDKLPSEPQPVNGAFAATGQNRRRNMGKRPLDDASDSEGGALPASKRPKQQGPPGQWWGPNNSRLSCDDSFFDVIRQYKAYIANPSEEPGTGAYRTKMTEFLRQALERAGLESHLGDLLLESEWSFRDPFMNSVRAPSFVQPSASESEGRLGLAGARGSNDFKTMLGGGLTADEQSFGNQVPPAFQGMVALAHSSSFRKDSLSLRGGNSDGAAADDGDNNDNGAETNARIRHGTRLLFRDPGDLWEQLIEDATYPSDAFQSRVEALRPPMIDPDRGGSAMKKHQEVMMSIPILDELDTIQQEQDTDVLEKKAEEYLEALINSRRDAHRFIHRRPGQVFPDEPTLSQPGGRDRPGGRYKGIQSRDFAEPIGHVFRARMYQVLRLAIYWRFHQSGLITLRDLLREEKLHLEIWDQHEEMYMEWENLRFFTLKSPYEISELTNRYNARELLRKMWEMERDEIDKAIKLLDEDPHYYDHPAPSPGSFTPPPEQKAILSGFPSRFLNSMGLGATKTFQPGARSINDFLFDISSDSSIDENADKAKTAEDTQDIYDISSDSSVDVNAGVIQDPFNNNNKNNNKNTHSGTKRPGKKTKVASGSRKTPDTINETIEICERIRDAYQENLDEVMRQNNDLDIDDPGNQAIISRNNIDVMAKQQLIWGLNTEIRNLKRPADPPAASSYGQGAAQKWELPAAEDYLRNTRQIPPKPELPLGVTSLGLGPMPGEHPSVGDPRIFLGAHSSFGRTPDPNEKAARDDAGDNLFANIARPPQAGAGTNMPADQQPSSSLAGAHVPSNTDHIPKDWGGFVALHQESLYASEPTGTAALDYDQWTESVYQALLSSTRNLRRNFPRGSPFRSTGEDLRRHVLEVYERSFGSPANHETMPWDQRERYRHRILDDFAADVNKALRDKGLPATFPQPGSPSFPVAFAAEVAGYDSKDDGAGSQSDSDTTLNKLREALRQKNQAKAAIRHLTRIQGSAQGLSVPLQEALDHAEESKRESKALYKSLRAKVDAATRAQEERDKLASAQAEEAAEDTPFPRPTPGAAADLDNTAEVVIAEEKVVEVTAAFRAAEEKAIKAVSDAKKAREAAATTSDGYLADLSVVAEKAEAEAGEEFRDAVVRLRLVGEALLAQQAWRAAPAETHEELGGRLDTVAQGLDIWVYEYRWDEWVLDGRSAMDQWIIDVVSFVHEAYKAVGLLIRVQDWYDLYEDFWITRGTSLVGMRAIWLHKLVAVLNSNIESEAWDTLIPTPPKPPVEWEGDPPPRAELLRQADAELASVKRRTSSAGTETPMTPQSTSVKAGAAAHVASGGSPGAESKIGGGATATVPATTPTEGAAAAAAAAASKAAPDPRAPRNIQSQ
ncbi:hypothetical protein F5B18DRAFT_203006 [Nemania serpens]|nr:hypothetical protein F5B18DRAFT_203006 [Nemania serpens]